MKERSGTLAVQSVPALNPEVDTIEQALADGIRAAAAAGRWHVVSQLSAELEARRLVRQSPDVVSLAAARAKRNGGAQ